MPTPEQRIRDFYGFAFPDDFFAFREFMAGLPRNTLADVCDMRPAFPFAVADGKSATDYPEHPRWEDRYYHDLPEFVTIFRGSCDGLHWGYFFDAPGELEPVVAHYWHSDTFEHACDGDNIFEAVRWTVERSYTEFTELMDDRRERDYSRLRLEQVDAVREQLTFYWGRDRPETGNEYTATYDEARSDIADGTWDRLGIIVPSGKYRPLSSDPLTHYTGYRVDPHRAEVERLAAEAMQFLRAGFPGAALKFGRDLWVWGKEFPECYELLDAAYAALAREPLRGALAEARAFQAFCDNPRR